MNKKPGTTYLPTCWSTSTIRRHAAIAFRLMTATERLRIGSEEWREEMVNILPEWRTFHLVTRELERLVLKLTDRRA